MKDNGTDYPECNHRAPTGWPGARPSQHRFRRGRPCLTKLISFYDRLNCLVDVGEAVNVVYLNFSKAFDTVCQSKLLAKLAAHGLYRGTLCWVRIWLGGQSDGEWCHIQLAASH